MNFNYLVIIQLLQSQKRMVKLFTFALLSKVWQWSNNDLLKSSKLGWWSDDVNDQMIISEGDQNLSIRSIHVTLILLKWSIKSNQVLKKNFLVQNKIEKNIK